MSWNREIWSCVLRVHRAGMLTVGRVVNRHRKNMYFVASCWPPSAVLSIWRCTFPIRCSAVAQTSVRRLRHCPSQSNAYKLWFKSCRYPRLRHELDGWDRFGWDRISVAKNAGHAKGFIRYLWFISRCINQSVLDNFPCWRDLQESVAVHRRCRHDMCGQCHPSLDRPHICMSPAEFP